MGRMSFTQELKALARQAGEGMDAGGCWGARVGPICGLLAEHDLSARGFDLFEDEPVVVD
jgi:hypothetical protein